MNIMQVRDNQGNLTWVETVPSSRQKIKIKESVMPSKLPTVEHMLANKPSLTSLLDKRPEHLCSEREDFLDTLNFALLTLGMILIGVMFFNQSMPIDILGSAIFLTMLILHIFIYKTDEKYDLERQKQWINQQAISVNLKTRYREDIVNKKSNIIWIVIRFCLFVALAIFIFALFTAVFDDKKQ
ncbi:hypothetical protein [Colwellia piezophila]|uniref:hypothetical protein n=1 Tax=Colwellia piezophila TaxID=211668 RepID=UPI000360EBEB|nr:hypothetical protein [Colwellia piezophila]